MSRINALLLATAATAVLCMGCVPVKFKKSQVSVKGDIESTIGSLFVWSSDVSAAIAYGPKAGRGPICMQRAMTAGATSVEASGSLSDAALKLADPTANAEGKELAGAALAVSNAVMALSVSTERTAYLDTGLFYLCQLHANGAMTSPEFASAVEKLIEKSATMPTAATSLGQLFAPQLQRGQRGEGNEESSTPAKDGTHGTPKAEGPKP